MVQVDVFWSFALGAGFAASAARQLKSHDKPFESCYFVTTLLYLSVLFVPSGATLLWGFPEWETMQAGSYRTIPAWLVMLFTLTNVTQGILGYWLALRLIRQGSFRGAYLLMSAAYFCMFFILVHGWDGTGYQRFFYSCTGWSLPDCLPWVKGTYSVFHWLVSPVAVTLYAMGLVMLPPLFHFMSDWTKRGYELSEVPLPGAASVTRGQLARSLFRIMFLHPIGAAIAASLLVHFLKWIAGPMVFAVLAYLVCVRPGGLTSREIDRVILQPGAASTT